MPASGIVVQYGKPCLRREDRGRVAADRHECAVAERDLAGVAGEDVEAADGDEVDADVGVLRGLEVVDEERQHRDCGDEEHDGQRGGE